MMGDPYKEAKLEKLKQLKKLMYELMSGEGADADEPLDMSAAMEAAEGEVNGVDDMESVDEEAGEDGEDMGMTELQKMKEEYFKPKTRERRPGTAVILSTSKTTKPLFDKKPMMDSMTSPMKKKPYSKKGRY